MLDCSSAVPIRTAKALSRRIRSQTSEAPKTKDPKMNPGLFRLFSNRWPFAVTKKYVRPHHMPNRHVRHETKPNDFQPCVTNRCLRQCSMASARGAIAMGRLMRKPMALNLVGRLLAMAVAATTITSAVKVPPTIPALTEINSLPIIHAFDLDFDFAPAPAAPAPTLFRFLAISR